jgi:hypothetical protein
MEFDCPRVANPFVDGAAPSQFIAFQSVFFTAKWLLLHPAALVMQAQSWMDEVGEEKRKGFMRSGRGTKLKIEAVELEDVDLSENQTSLSGRAHLLSSSPDIMH